MALYALYCSNLARSANFRSHVTFIVLRNVRAWFVQNSSLYLIARCAS